MNERIQSLIQRSDAIPSMPPIVTRFLEITSDANYSAQDVVNLLSTDPGIASIPSRLPTAGASRVVPPGTGGRRQGVPIPADRPGPHTDRAPTSVETVLPVESDHETAINRW